VSVLLFNHTTHELHATSAATATAKREIAAKLEAVHPGGGTQLSAGFAAGMGSLASAASASPENHALRRVYFLTDMQSGLNDEAAVLAEAARRAGDVSLPLHTTVVGMGVDLSVGTVESLSSIPGGKYASVSNGADFVRSVGEEFSHDVTPIAFDLQISAQHGWAFEKVAGSAELNSLAPGATCLTISSEFANPLDDTRLAPGAIFLAKMCPPPTSADPTAMELPSARRVSPRRADVEEVAAPPADHTTQLQLNVTWRDAQGLPGATTRTLACPPLAVAPAPLVLRKALALVRFCDLQQAFCEGSDGEGLDVRRARLDQCRRGRETLLHEMEAVGDATLSARNANILQTLDQIIELEARDVIEMESAAAATAQAAATAAAGVAHSGRLTRAAKRSLPATATAASAAADPVTTVAVSRRRKARDSPPVAFLCPITKMLMSDPVCTADGHTFENTAITQWLQAHSTSPLTGLPLTHKTLTKNHSLRGLIREWEGA